VAKIINITGRPHVFTLTDGKTLRVFARKTAETANHLVSPEIKSAEKLGLIRIVGYVAPVPEKSAEDTPANPKQSKKTPVTEKSAADEKGENT
jgi:hypothetical protein